MKKFICVIALVASSLTYAGPIERTQEILEDAVWACELGFNMEAKGLRVLVGSFEAEGIGKLNCISAFGEKESMNVKVFLSNPKIGLSIAAGKFNLVAMSAKLGLLNESPEDLLGEYYVGGLQLSAGLGAGAYVATHVGIPSIVLDIAFQLTTGFGGSIGLTKMTIERM